MLQCIFAHPELRKNIRFKSFFQLISADVFQRFLFGLSGCIVYKNIKFAKFFYGILYCLLAKSFIANITWKQQTFASILFYFHFYLFSIFMFTQINDRYISAVLSKQNCCRCAYATVPTCN